MNQPVYSERSEEKLRTCHPDLQGLFRAVLPHFDHAILCGHRDKEAQAAAFADGRSKLEYPDSKHNAYPSRAIDVAPYPLDWKDKARFYMFAGFVRGVAATQGLKIRWGGDWDQDTHVKDNGFNDLVHFELI